MQDHHQGYEQNNQRCDGLPDLIGGQLSWVVFIVALWVTQQAGRQVSHHQKTAQNQD